MPRGRPRKLKDIEQTEIKKDSGVVMVEYKDEKNEPENSKEERTVLKFKPFNGDTKKLSPPIFDKKGRIKNSGEPEFFLRQTRTGYDLIKIYRNGKGIARRLVHPFKTVLQNQKCLKNRKTVESMKAAGIPVY